MAQASPSHPPRRGAARFALAMVNLDRKRRTVRVLPGSPFTCWIKPPSLRMARTSVGRAGKAGFRGHNIGLRLCEIRCFAGTTTCGGHHRLDRVPRLFLR